MQRRGTGEVFRVYVHSLKPKRPCRDGLLLMKCRKILLRHTLKIIQDVRPKGQGWSVQPYTQPVCRM